MTFSIGVKWFVDDIIMPILWKMESVCLLCRFMTPTRPPNDLTMIYWHSFGLFDCKFYFIIVVSKEAFATIINNILRAIWIIQNENKTTKDRTQHERNPTKEFIENHFFFSEIIFVLLDDDRTWNKNKTKPKVKKSTVNCKYLREIERIPIMRLTCKPFLIEYIDLFKYTYKYKWIL